MWVTLRNLPFEHVDQAQNIVESLGEVVGIDKLNPMMSDPMFCVNLNIKKWWVSSIILGAEDENLPSHNIVVDYDTLPFRCKSCLNWKHNVKDCKENIESVRGPRNASYATYKHPHNRNKKLDIDQDGFKAVKNRKATKRALFEEEEEIRKNNLWEELKNQQKNGASNSNGTSVANSGD